MRACLGDGVDGDGTEQYKTAADLELFSEVLENRRRAGSVAGAIEQAEAELASRPADDPTRRKPKVLTLKRKADDVTKGKAGKKSKRSSDDSDDDEDEDEEEEEDSDEEEEEEEEEETSDEEEDSDDEDPLTSLCGEAQEGMKELTKALKAAQKARDKIKEAITGAGKCEVDDVALLSSSGWCALPLVCRGAVVENTMCCTAPQPAYPHLQCDMRGC